MQPTMWWEKYLADHEKIQKWRWGPDTIEFLHFYDQLQLEPLVFEQLSVNHEISVTSNEVIRKKVFDSMLQTLKTNNNSRVTLDTMQLFCLLAKTNISGDNIEIILDVLAMYIAAYSFHYNIALRLCSIVELTIIDFHSTSNIHQLPLVVSNLYSTYLDFYVFLFSETKTHSCDNLEFEIDQMVNLTQDISLETIKLMCFGVERRDHYNLNMGDSVKLCRKMLSLLHPEVFCSNPFYYFIFDTELTLKSKQGKLMNVFNVFLSVKQSRTEFSLSKLPIELFRTLKDFLI
jgi:hypothetical protein